MPQDLLTVFRNLNVHYRTPVNANVQVNWQELLQKAYFQPFFA